MLAEQSSFEAYPLSFEDFCNRIFVFPSLFSPSFLQSSPDDLYDSSLEGERKRDEGLTDLCAGNTFNTLSPNMIIWIHPSFTFKSFFQISSLFDPSFAKLFSESSFLSRSIFRSRARSLFARPSSSNLELPTDLKPK